MLLRLYRRKIARRVEDKMCYMGSCPNEMDIVCNIIAPKDYKRGKSHCGADCWKQDCEVYKKYHTNKKGE